MLQQCLPEQLRLASVLMHVMSGSNGFDLFCCCKGQLLCGHLRLLSLCCLSDAAVCTRFRSAAVDRPVGLYIC
jgi:hypothetical protein